MWKVNDGRRNSTKLDRKQDFNVLYQVCVLGRSEKQDGRPASDWLRHFRRLWNRCTELNEGSVPVDFSRPKFWVAHTKDDVISILMHKYTYTNMYIIKKIISCRFILCRDITSLFKPYEKSCRRRKVKIEKILTVTYRTLLTKTTNFLKSGGYKICLYLKIISYST